MASNNTLPPLPNPFTPLAFLPPTVADQYQISTYVFVATLSAFIWDWLTSIPDEIKMCRRKKFSPAIIPYFLSRIGVLQHVLMIVIFQAAPLPHCTSFIRILLIGIILAVPSSSALFFLRVRVVYGNNNIVTAFFGVLLIALFGVCLALPTAVQGAHIGTTKRCIATVVETYISAPVILNTINATLVFLAISLRIISYSLVGDTFGARLRSFLRGDGLPNISKSVLQGGQLYYFVTVGLNIVTISLWFSPLPPVYHSILNPSNIALESVMACRVFRGLRLGLIEGHGETVTRSESHRLTGLGTTTHEYALKSVALERSRQVPLTVEITKITESV